MRDEHRPKQELIHEITGLRKQVGDLKDAMTARRRIEDALREATVLLRNLSDGAPVGLALFRPDGALLASNQRFACMLGYQSPAELHSLGSVLGVFASPEDQNRALDSSRSGPAPRPTLFRGKDGSRVLRGVLAGAQPEACTVVLAVFDCTPNLSPFLSPPA